jgi:hypothetical protein
LVSVDGPDFKTMTQEKKKPRFAVTIAVLVALVIGGLLIANWDDFKTGFVAGYTGQAKPRP